MGKNATLFFLFVLKECGHLNYSAGFLVNSWSQIYNFRWRMLLSFPCPGVIMFSCFYAYVSWLPNKPINRESTSSTMPLSQLWYLSLIILSWCCFLLLKLFIFIMNDIMFPCQGTKCILSQFTKIVTAKCYIWTKLTPLTFSKMAKITVFKVWFMGTVCQRNFYAITVSDAAVPTPSMNKLLIAQLINALLVFCGQL